MKLSFYSLGFKLKLINKLFVLLIFIILLSNTCSNRSEKTSFGFEIFLLSKYEANTGKILFPEKALLSAKDIIHFEWLTQTLKLTSKASKEFKLNFEELGGSFGNNNYFLVTINRNPIYIGYFWSDLVAHNLYPISFPNIYISYNKEMKELKLDFKLYNTSRYPEKDYNYDPRKDKRIYDFFKNINKLKR